MGEAATHLPTKNRLSPLRPYGPPRRGRARLQRTFQRRIVSRPFGPTAHHDEDGRGGSAPSNKESPLAPSARTPTPTWVGEPAAHFPTKNRPSPLRPTTTRKGEAAAHHPTMNRLSPRPYGPADGITDFIRT